MDDSPFMYLLFLLFQVAPGLLLLVLAVKIDRRRRASGKRSFISSAGIGFRPTGPGGRWTRGDRLRNAARAAAVAIVAAALAIGVAALAEQASGRTALGTGLSVAGALLFVVAFLSTVVTLLELVRVPFTRG